MGIFERMMEYARQFERESGIPEEDVERSGRISPCEAELISKLSGVSFPADRETTAACES